MTYYIVEYAQHQVAAVLTYSRGARTYAVDGKAMYRTTQMDLKAGVMYSIRVVPIGSPTGGENRGIPSPDIQVTIPQPGRPV